MKRFVGYIANKIVKSLPRKKKVSPDIKSVKPTKLKIGESIKKAKQDEFRTRYTALDKAEAKLKTGKQMMKEGQKERKKLVDTGRAIQFKHTKSFSAINPGTKDRFKGITKEEKPKKFKTGKQLEAEKKPKENKKMGFNEYKKSLREKKMGGGMMGRRFGYKKGSKFPDLTGDGKVTFADILKGRGVINGKKKKKKA
jgi:hypothetical protein